MVVVFALLLAGCELWCALTGAFLGVVIVCGSRIRKYSLGIAVVFAQHSVNLVFDNSRQKQSF